MAWREKLLCSEHEGNQTGAADPCSQYSGQHSEHQISWEIYNDTLTLFFTLSVNEHMMHGVSIKNKRGGIISLFCPVFPLQHTWHKNALVDLQSPLHPDTSKKGDTSYRRKFNL